MVEQLFKEFDHAVATTSGFKVCYLPSMTDTQKIDWVEKMAGESGIPWLRLARTALRGWAHCRGLRSHS